MTSHSTLRPLKLVVLSVFVLEAAVVHYYITIQSHCLVDFLSSCALLKKFFFYRFCFLVLFFCKGLNFKCLNKTEKCDNMNASLIKYTARGSIALENVYYL